MAERGNPKYRKDYKPQCLCRQNKKAIWAYVREKTERERDAPKNRVCPLYSVDNTCYLRAPSMFVLSNSCGNANERNPSKFPL